MTTEKDKERTRRWRINNPEKYKARYLDYYKRKKAKIAQEFTQQRGDKSCLNTDTIK